MDKRRIVSGLLMLFLVCAFAWSGGQQTTTSAGVDVVNTPYSGAPEPVVMPIAKGDLELRIFANLDARVATTLTSYDEMLAYQELEKRSGIDFNFVHVPPDRAAEKFNLMVATNDLPDIVWYDWPGVPGGPEKAIADGQIVLLNNLIDRYAPNYKKLLARLPELQKEVLTDTGKYYYFPLVREAAVCRQSDGFQIRKDWLDKIGMEVPTTIDEWYRVLKAFKTNDLNGNGKADEIPLISLQVKEERRPVSIINFASAWGVYYKFYQVDGKVKFGPAESEFKEYLKTMAKWYREGLIDPDYHSIDRKSFDAKVTNNEAGSYFGMLNSYMGKFTGLMQGTGFELASVPFSTLKKGGQGYNFSPASASIAAGVGFAISANNEHLVESMKLIDYLYSEEGIWLMNFGIEGNTYTMRNGKPVYTDKIMKSPKGLAPVDALSEFLPAGASCRVYQHEDYWLQMMMYPNQVEALKILSKGSIERSMPNSVTPTPEEAERFAVIMNEINTYRDEMINKFIVGIEPINDASFAVFVDTMKSFGLDEAIMIQQGALDRYNNRLK
jgi:putative aldouronate transport system substrate-binding protein